MAEIQPSGASFGLGADPTVYDGLVKLTRAGNALVYNAALGDADFRIAGDTDANLFVTDAGNDRVGIGIAAPTLKLDVVGSIGTSTGTLVDTGAPSGVLIFRGTTAGRNLTVSTGSSGVLYASFGTAVDVFHTWSIEGGPVLMVLDASGDLQIDGDLLVDGGNIGITADPDLLAMAANVLTVNGGVTTTGNLLVDGGDIGITAKSDLITLASDAVEIDGELQMQGDSAVRLGQVNTVNMNDNIGGGVSNLLFNLNDSTVYVCTGAGAPGSATWVALH